MSDVKFQEPVNDSVAKVDDTVAVGEDLEFQRRWWRFEKAAWIVFVLILLADVLGVFGRGYLSKAELQTVDHSLHVKYERTERASTPSIMTIELGSAAIQNGRAQLFTSESIVKELGSQRISPQPASSVLSPGGITYTFLASSGPVFVQLALEPSFPGVHNFSLHVPGFETVQSRIFVVP